MAKSSKNSPAPSGFEEAPQAGLTGTPLSGSVADWAEELARAAEMEGIESARSLASKAGKHRKKVEIAAANALRSPDREDNAKPAKGASKVTASKSARGTSMGGSTDPKTRAAAGLTAVAGMDLTVDEAGTELNAGSAVTATVEALSALIESGNPLFKDGKN